MRIHLANIKSQTRQPRTHLRILNQKPENLEPIRQIPNQFDKIEPIWSIQDQTENLNSFHLATSKPSDKN